jgi:hypothetical protein
MTRLERAARRQSRLRRADPVPQNDEEVHASDRPTSGPTSSSKTSSHAAKE